MALTVPKIIYPTGGGTTLTFVYPPRLVPNPPLQAIKHTNLASSGVQETIYERTDEFFQFTMEYVKIGSDLSAWDAFVRSALQGTAFDYYPDSTLSSHTTYFLEDTNWTAAFKQLGIYTFQMKFRKRVAWP